MYKTIITEKIKKLLFLSVFLSVFLFSGQVQAQLLNSKGKKALTGDMNQAGRTGDYNINSTVADVASLIVSAVLSLLGIIFLVMIIIGGFNWMTAAGSEDKVTKAKATLFRGIIGLFIVVAAYAITAFVFGAIGGIVGKPS